MPAGPADDDDSPVRPATDGAITDVFAARRAGATVTPPADHDQAGSGRDEDEGRPSTAELAELGLPVRVRQASLAPQLRDSRPAQMQPPSPPSAEPEAASPEAARSTMSALQRGWQLGRAEAGGWPASTEASPDETASPADDDPPPSPDGDDERAAD